MEPKQKPGRSNQVYRTPPDFLAAVSQTFGRIALDLAADGPNVCARWLGPGSSIVEDSLDSRWDWYQLVPTGLLAWLNPPFSNIAPWARKCVEQAARGMRIAMLTPYSCGERYDIVHPHALTLGLRPRLTFVGESSSYPKDLALSLFGFGLVGMGTWRWSEATRCGAK